MGALMFIIVGIYGFIPHPHSHLTHKKLWEKHIISNYHSLQQWAGYRFRYEIIMLIVASCVMSYSLWDALTVIMWCVMMKKSIYYYRHVHDIHRKCCELSAIIKHITDMLTSGQLLRSALRIIAEHDYSAYATEKLFILLNQLECSRTLEIDYSSYEEIVDSFVTFPLAKDLHCPAKSPVVLPELKEKISTIPQEICDQLWQYFYHIVYLGNNHGISLVNLCQSLNSYIDMIIRTDEKLAASTAGAKMSIRCLAFLPAMGILLGSAIGAHPVSLLLHTELGAILIFMGSICMILGLQWSRRIVVHVGEGA